MTQNAYHKNFGPRIVALGGIASDLPPVVVPFFKLLSLILFLVLFLILVLAPALRLLSFSSPAYNHYLLFLV